MSALAVCHSSSARGRHRLDPQAAVRPRNRRPLVAVGPFAMLVAVMVGSWTAHLLEYARVWGSTGYRSVVSRSVHAYMGPVGLVLVVTAGVGCSATRWMASRLERRITTASPSLRSLGAGSDSTLVTTVPALVALLWGCQLTVYLAQENLEASAAHVPMPGAAVFAGPHLVAPAVHLIVAVGIAGLLYLTRRRFTRVTREWREFIGHLALVAPVQPHPVLTGRVRRTWTPLDRWGPHSWCRPPPRMAS